MNSFPIFAGGNPISKIPNGFFDGLGMLEEFSCYACSLGPTLHSGTLSFGNQAQSYVDLRFNNIKFVETGAITGMLMSISLKLNAFKINGNNEKVPSILRRYVARDSHLSCRYGLLKCRSIFSLCTNGLRIFHSRYICLTKNHERRNMYFSITCSTIHSFSLRHKPCT